MTTLSVVHLEEQAAMPHCLDNIDDTAVIDYGNTAAASTVGCSDLSIN